VGLDQSQKQSVAPPSLSPYVYLWIVLTTILTYEYVALNRLGPVPSILRKLQSIGKISKDFKLITEPGDQISYMLGIVGFALICSTNLYILKKKRHVSKPKGSLTPWLNYHIFFGLMGPTLIVFHSNFKVGGLVAISFWSMIVCFVSGVIGRYFYLQLLREQRDMKRTLDKYEDAFEKARRSANQPWDPQVMAEAKWRSFIYVGGSTQLQTGNMALPLVLIDTLIGDLRRLLMQCRFPAQLPRSLYKPLLEYAMIKRRFHSSDQYKMLMGYWHTFHIPFAIFMYVVSVIHIVVAVTMKVK